MGKLHHIDFHHNMVQKHPPTSQDRIRHESPVLALTRDEFDAWEQAHLAIRARQTASRSGQIVLSDGAWEAAVTRMRPLRETTSIIAPKTVPRARTWFARVLHRWFGV